MGLRQSVLFRLSQTMKVGKMPIQQRENIFLSPCQLHCLHLIIEDIAKRKTLKEVIERAKKITIFFFYQSNKLVAIMKNCTNNHELLWSGITRFGTHFIGLESIYNYKYGGKLL